MANIDAEYYDHPMEPLFLEDTTNSFGELMDSFDANPSDASIPPLTDSPATLPEQQEIITPPVAKLSPSNSSATYPQVSGGLEQPSEDAQRKDIHRNIDPVTETTESITPQSPLRDHHEKPLAVIPRELKGGEADSELRIPESQIPTIEVPKICLAQKPGSPHKTPEVENSQLVNDPSADRYSEATEFATSAKSFHRQLHQGLPDMPVHVSSSGSSKKFQTQAEIQAEKARVYWELINLGISPEVAATQCHRNIPSYAPDPNPAKNRPRGTKGMAESQGGRGRKAHAHPIIYKEKYSYIKVHQALNFHLYPPRSHSSTSGSGYHPNWDYVMLPYQAPGNPHSDLQIFERDHHSGALFLAGEHPWGRQQGVIPISQAEQDFQTQWMAPNYDSTIPNGQSQGGIQMPRPQENIQDQLRSQVTNRANLGRSREPQEEFSISQPERNSHELVEHCEPIALDRAFRKLGQGNNAFTREEFIALMEHENSKMGFQEGGQTQMTLDF
jgi:hypothetical protein